MILTAIIAIITLLIYKISYKKDSLKAYVAAVCVLFIGMAVITISRLSYNAYITNNAKELEAKYQIEYMDEYHIKINGTEYKYVMAYDPDTKTPYAKICIKNKSFWDYVLITNTCDIVKIYTNNLESINK